MWLHHDRSNLVTSKNVHTKQRQKEGEISFVITFSIYILKSSGINFLPHISILYYMSGGKVQILLEKVRPHLFQEHLFYFRVKHCLTPNMGVNCVFQSLSLPSQKNHCDIVSFGKKAQYFRNFSRRHSQDSFKQLLSRKGAAFNNHVEDIDTG